MLRYARAARGGGRRALPVARRPAARRRACCRAGAPLVLTAHDVLPREPRRGQRARAAQRLYRRVDAVVVHTEHGRERLVARARPRPGEGARDPARRVHAPARAARRAPAAARARPAVEAAGRAALRAAAAVQGDRRAAATPGSGIDGAELWVVGMPRMDIGAAARARAAGRALRRALRGRRGDAGALAPRRPRRAALPRDRPVRACSSPRWPSAARCCSAPSAASPSSPRPARPQLVPPGDAGALHAALRALLGDAAARERLAAGRARGGARALRLGRDRPQPSRALPRAAASGEAAPRPSLWGSAAPARLRAGRLSAAAGRAGARCARRPTRGAREPAGPPAEPRVSLIVAAHREAEVIAEKVANARALDWPADRLEVIVACDGSPDDTAAARARGAAPTSCSSCRGAARSARRTRPSRARGGELLAFSDANARWEPGALRALVGALRRPARRLRLRPGALRRRRPAPTRRASTGATRWRSARSSRALASVTAGNGAIYAVRRAGLRPRRPGDGPRPVAALQARQARLARGRTSPERRATEKMVPTIEGEFARKRRMMSHAWPIVLRGGLLSPRGYPPLYALMIASHRAAALRRAAPARRGARRCERCRAAQPDLRAPRSARSSRCWRAAAAGGARPRAPAARRALLRPDHGLDRGRPVGPPAPRHARRLGAAGGHALMRQRAPSTSSSPAPRWRSARRFLLVAMVGDPARVAGQPDLPPAARRPGRPAVRRAQAAHDGQRRRAPRRAGWPSSEGDARITRVGRAAAAHVARRAAQPRQRAARRDGDRRPAPDGARAGRPLHRAPARPPGGQAGDHRLGAGQRPHRAALGRAHRARPLVHRAPLVAAGPADPVAHRADGARRRGPLPRRGARLARPVGRRAGGRSRPTG